MEGHIAICNLVSHRSDNLTYLAEEEHLMSAMSNLHLELTSAMTHTANKLLEAVEDGSGEILEATCNVAMEYLQICADALRQVREASEGVSNGN